MWYGKYDDNEPEPLTCEDVRRISASEARRIAAEVYREESIREKYGNVNPLTLLATPSEIQEILRRESCAPRAWCARLRYSPRDSE